MEQVQKLTDAVVNLTKDVETLRQSFDRRTVAIITLGLALLLTVGGMGYVATRVQADNDRRIAENNLRWCPMVLLFVPQPTDPPATTERGRRIAATATSLAAAFGCAPTA